MPDTEIQTGKFTVQRLPPLAAPPALAHPSAALDGTPPAGVCANCGTRLAGPYCANCGQHVADFHRSVWRFVTDFLDNAFCWDNKLLRTLEPLLKQPGFLTREFMLGRRVRYVHPLRLFLFTSAVCLTLLQFGHNNVIQYGVGDKTHRIERGVHVNFGDESSPAPTVKPAVPDALAAPLTAPVANGSDATTTGNKDGSDDDDPSVAAIKQKVADALAKAGKAKEEASAKSEGAIDRAVEAKIRAVGGTERFSRAISDGVEHRLSWVALALLPIFAMGLRALYWRNDRFYFEHLIFSLHYHTFLFLFWTAYVAVLAVASWLPFHGLIEAMIRLGLLVPPVYLYLALRGMYGDTRKRTVIKVLLLGSMHMVAILIGVAVVGAAAFFSAK